MKKMKKLVVICMLMVVIAWQSQNLIVETMRIVDFYGEKTNTNVVEIIDKLNDLWYFVEDLKYLVSFPNGSCKNLSKYGGFGIYLCRFL